MITTFWSGLAGRLADRTALALFSPASAFWLVGFLGWSQGDPVGRLRSLAERVAGQPQLIEWLVLISGLAVLLISGVITERLVPVAMAVLQGEWTVLFRPLTRRLTAHQFRIKEQLESRWETLYSDVAQAQKAAEGPEPGPAASRLVETEQELLDVERRLGRYPIRSQRVAPTRFGNVMRAADARVLDKYGLDAARCWPALWLVVPDIVREQVAAARRTLDAAVLWWVWSILLAIWLVLDLRVLVPVVVSAVIAYRSAVTAAAQYGDLIDAAYTVHRGALYDAVNWPRPAGPDTEVASGEALTTSLWRGPALAEPPSGS